jgi:hypothetical protein
MTATVSKELEVELTQQDQLVLPAEAETEGLEISELAAACKHLRELGQPGNTRLTLSHIDGDVFDDFSEVVYPMLLSKAAAVEMTIPELADELDFVIRMANRDDIFRGVYLYSVQVSKPLHISEDVDKKFVERFTPSEFLIDVMRGYLYHSFLYQTERGTLMPVLLEVLSKADEVQVLLRRGVHHEYEERKTVTMLREAE